VEYNDIIYILYIIIILYIININIMYNRNRSYYHVLSLRIFSSRDKCTSFILSTRKRQKKKVRELKRVGGERERERCKRNAATAAAVALKEQ
jgi:hypothetical protein